MRLHFSFRSPSRRFVVLPNVTEVGTDPALQRSGGGQCLLLPPSPDVAPRHCVLAHTDGGVVTVTPCHREAEVFVDQRRVFETSIVQHGSLVRFGRNGKTFRFLDPLVAERERMRQFTSSATLPEQADLNNTNNYSFFPAAVAPPPPQQAQVPGKDNILPAVLEFREESEEAFFNAITLSLDVARVQFRLAPTYTIYMATRFRASTHYRPELVPEERAVRLTEMLNSVAERVFATVGQAGAVAAPNGAVGDAARLAFWMANSSELLHFLKSDRHITSFSLQAQDILAECVHTAFKHLVVCLQSDLRQALPQMLSPQEQEDEIKGIMQVMANKANCSSLPSMNDAPFSSPQILSSAMNLLRKCRVNAALTIQLFSQLFHFVNMWTFNQIVSSQQPNYCTHRWGLRLKRRLAKIEAWAEKQGLELAADCHLARVVQAAHLLLARKNTAEDIASVSSICFKLNSLQLKTLLNKYEASADETPISPDMVDTIVRVAENTVDEMAASEGREVRLEEEPVLRLPFLLPEDGYSCDVVRGVPGGLAEFVGPLHRVGLCVMTPQPTSSGFWTIYMDRLDVTPAMSSPVPSEASHSSYHRFNNGGDFQQMQQQQSQQHMSPPPVLQQQEPPPPRGEPEVVRIQLAKFTNGMGLSIVAAKGVGKDRLGIYVKAVVEGGAAHHDGRLQAGDQLLSVDGQSLVGITQERAAEFMMHTGPVVELEVAKQGAIYHGLSPLLSQPSPVLARANGGGDQQRSKSVSSLYGEAGQHQQQHLYQNHGESFQHHPQAGPPPMLRSTTAPIGGLNGPRPAFAGGPPRPHFASPATDAEEQAFYQNVSQSELFHATPRVSGTPGGEGGLSPGGPEKPQRHWAYNNGRLPQQQQQQHQQQQQPVAWYFNKKSIYTQINLFYYRFLHHPRTEIHICQDKPEKERKI